MENRKCPVCNGGELARTVERRHLPAMQNYVYRTPELARGANAGNFCLAICADCGFGHNCEFAAELLTYDRGYDNSVPSAVMGAYYESLADYLNATYLRDQGLIVDVGCGKGTFLHTLSKKYPRVRGLGIDPSYEGPLEENRGQLKFIRDIFREGQLVERPDLVICRHVLEHMQRPVEFMASLSSALTSYPGVPIFVEVPDLNWILEHQAFWDFCYEHCNYFSQRSFAAAVDRAGFAVNRVQTGFGDQYLWLEGATIAESTAPTANGKRLTDLATEYVRSENSLVERGRLRLLELKRQGHRIVVWGMATKGVLFSHLVDPNNTLIDHCVDINANKHGCYTPVTAHRIESPQVLASHAAEQLAVVVMNENYWREILATCQSMRLSPTLLNASGQILVDPSGSSIAKCHPERGLPTEGSGSQYLHALIACED